MLATLLQLAALVGFPVSGLLDITSRPGGLIAGLSVSAWLVGVAWEQNRPGG